MIDLEFWEPLNFWFLAPFLPFAVFVFFCKSFLKRKFNEFFSIKNSGGRWQLRLIFLLSSFLMLILSSAQPVLKIGGGYNYFAVVDISLSMECLDYKDKAGNLISRLDMVKLNLLSFLDKLPPNSRLGLAVFGQPSFEYFTPEVFNKEEHKYFVESWRYCNPRLLVLVRPQEVREFYWELRGMIKGISHEWAWEAGSPVKESIVRVGELIAEEKKKYGEGLTIILASDFEDRYSYLGDRETFVQLQGSELGKAKLFLAGFGNSDGGFVPDYDMQGQMRGYKINDSGKNIVSRFDKNLMLKISNLFSASHKEIKGDSDLDFLTKDSSFKTGENKTGVPIFKEVCLLSLVFFLLSIFV